ncbi:MAG: hypothetical protein ACPGUV_09200, partial [Polyangiales bacterium]
APAQWHIERTAEQTTITLRLQQQEKRVDTAAAALAGKAAKAKPSAPIGKPATQHAGAGSTRIQTHSETPRGAGSGRADTATGSSSEGQSSDAPTHTQAVQHAASVPSAMGMHIKLILWACGLLALLWLGLNFVRQGRRKTEEDPIAVVAAKRLAPKHQLMVVRALGQEHLISVQGNQTLRLASTALEGTAQADAVDDALEPAPLYSWGGRTRPDNTVEDSSAARTGIEATAKARRKTGLPSHKRAAVSSAQGAFGSQLLERLRQPQGTALPSLDISAGVLPPRTHSKAVSGLLRLRQMHALTK